MKLDQQGRVLYLDRWAGGTDCTAVPCSTLTADAYTPHAVGWALPTNIGGRGRDFLSIDKETGSEKPSDWPTVTQQVSGEDKDLS